MRRGATGCARVVSRRANLAAVSSQFWKTFRVAQHQAATPPCLSRGIRSTAVKMDEKLYIHFIKFGPIVYLRRRSIYVTEEAFGCVQYFADGVNKGSSITFCKKCVCSTSRLSATTRKRAHSFNELLLTVYFTQCNSS